MQSPQKRKKTSHYPDMKFPTLHKFYAEMKSLVNSDISYSYQPPNTAALSTTDSQKHLPVEFGSSLKHLPVEFGSSLKHLPVELGSSLKHLPVELGSSLKHLPVELGSSLSNLESGVELSTASFNISEALLSLSVFKQDYHNSNFQYILGAATSPAVKLNEDTLTYLNQMQSYELKLKKLSDLTGSKGYLRSTVRVCFHDRRLQYTEREQLNFWSKDRPGVRILDIDIASSYGLVDVNVNPREHNTIDFVWDPSKDTGIYVKVNCISTEFSPKKHGGEKGVPFRLQVETRESERQESQLIHCAFCLIRVFRLKGADRKLYTDWQKMNKKTDSEKGNYRPSYEYTVLNEIPVEQVIQAKFDKAQSLVHTKSEISSSKAQFCQLSQPICHTHSSPIKTDIQRISSQYELKSPPSSPFSTDSVSSEGSVMSWVPTMISVNATATEVKTWLFHNRFAKFVNVFRNFTGADILRLDREDLVQICGLADGIRLNNALLSHAVRPKLTVFMCTQTDPAYTAVYMEQFSSQELNQKIREIAKIGQHAVSDVFLQGPSAINVRLTNDVVRNMPDKARLVIKIMNDTNNADCIRILIQSEE
ncbi:hypothetical protein DPMN_037562 [Dreissena polymorpha]|uniref:Grh/CP2 DB domain-containing protein n=2 Tax=Dreissena polymorpha TaxID=45954 RepID=A0A9D4RPX8_DREPO|nr:hypothetical protein DPMN_037562 [Dreissena polymorpha]